MNIMNDNGFENVVLDEIHLEYIKDKLPDDIKKLQEKLQEDIEKLTTTLAIHYQAIDEARNHVEMNSASVEILQENVVKYRENFDNIGKRFESIQVQTKIFHTNIKNNKN